MYLRNRGLSGGGWITATHVTGGRVYADCPQGPELCQIEKEGLKSQLGGTARLTPACLAQGESLLDAVYSAAGVTEAEYAYLNSLLGNNSEVPSGCLVTGATTPTMTTDTIPEIASAINTATIVGGIVLVVALYFIFGD